MKICCLIFLLSASLHLLVAQDFQYQNSIGKFNQASSFHMNSAGFIFVTDRGTNQIFKLDTLGNFIKDNGGFGWDAGAFDDPQGIFATALNVYVCDKNNHRIQFFDKDLNFLSQLKTRDSENEELQFGYPSSVTVNNQGDLFILDTENKRVLKFDLFGNFVQHFGGYNYGKYTLNEPLKLAAGPGNLIYVIDKNRIVIFDHYGNGVGELTTEQKITDINIMFSKMSVISENRILTASADNNEFNFVEAVLNDYDDAELLSSIIFNNKLYLLTSKKIDVFTGSVK